MSEIDFPFLAMVLSGLFAYLLGLFWYHPKVLGTKWLEARSVDKAAEPPGFKEFIFSFLLWMLAACFYSFLVSILEIHEVPGYFGLSCLLWVAFAMPPLVMGSFYTGYPFEAVSIDAAYQLAGYYVFAVLHLILGDVTLL